MPSPAQSSNLSRSRESGRFRAVYRVLEEAIAARAFPGCVFGVLARGEMVLTDGLGRFTYDPESPLVTADTVYDVASITKVVATTAATMLLVQRGEIDLDLPLGELLPGFIAGRASGDPARRVTLRHLLAHNSGLPGYVELFRTATTPAALFEACLKLPLEAEPGARADYSDPGFILLGKALEVRMGEPLDSWVKRGVFEPLGMNATGFCPVPAGRKSIPPTEEDTWFRHRLIQGEVQDENAWVLGGVAGHAGLFSNIAELLRFADAVINTNTGATNTDTNAGNVPDEKRFLFDSDVVKQFTERQPPVGSDRALGWDTPSANSSAGRYFTAHSVGHLAFSGCSLWIDLDAAVAVVLLTNRTWPDRKNQMIREVRPAFHDAIREALQR
jgi:serine-type D-Ala-D-Ala carboxypeptidase